LARATEAECPVPAVGRSPRFCGIMGSFCDRRGRTNAESFPLGRPKRSARGPTGGKPRSSSVATPALLITCRASEHCQRSLCVVASARFLNSRPTRLSRDRGHRTASPVRAYGPTSRLALRSALPECLPLMGRRPAFFGFRSQGLSRLQPSLSQTHPRKHVTALTTLCWNDASPGSGKSDPSRLETNPNEHR
jgi:hypothetical protein